VAVVDLDDYYTKQRNEKQNDKKKQMEAANILRSYHAGGGPESLSSSAAKNKVKVADLSNSMPVGVGAEVEAEAEAKKTNEIEISEPESKSDTEVAFNFSAFRDQLERKAKSGAVVSLDDHYNKQRNEKQNDKKRQIEAANILRSYHAGGGGGSESLSTSAAKKMDVDSNSNSNSIDIMSPSDDGCTGTGTGTGTGTAPAPVPEEELDEKKETCDCIDADDGLQSPEVYSTCDISNIPKHKHLLSPPDRKYMKMGIFKCFGFICVD